jgi:hypothetical protein
MRHSVLTIILLGVLAVPARATVIVPADLPELAHDARAIVRGQVVAVTAQWTEDRRTIETVVTLEPERYLKGELGELVHFRVPGGTMGRFQNIVMGAPRFQVGQRVIVFLGASGPRVPFVLGLSQGVYRVALTSDGREMVAPPPVMPGVAGPVVRGAAALRPARLVDFERNVETLLEAGR